MSALPVCGRPTRRRFLAISAAAMGLAAFPLAARAAVPVHRWRGIALGAAAEIRLVHPDKQTAETIFARAEAEIRRLEAIFSLYREDSALSQLNRAGKLETPPLDLVELLALSARLHEATGGAFDPSVQPLWRAYAEGFAASADGPDAEAIETARARVDFAAVRITPEAIHLGRAGMALTLNGIAQGFVTDRVSALLRAEGMSDILVDLGEIRANGSNADGDGWDVTLDPDHAGAGPAERVRIRDRAVASSAGLGTTFDADRRVGHILDPRSGRPAVRGLRGASVIAASAALADGLSTAALVSGRDALAEALKAFPGTQARLVDDAGAVEWLRG